MHGDQHDCPVADSACLVSGIHRKASEVLIIAGMRSPAKPVDYRGADRKDTGGPVKGRRLRR